MLKPIETEYNGYRFRSRLEARWAVFFDKIGIRYEYEKEGYDLDGVWYLPDFWLPNHDHWVEIKGERLQVGGMDEEKIKRLVRQSRKQVAVFWGQIDTKLNLPILYRLASPLEDFVIADKESPWTECPVCHMIGLANNGRPSFLPCGCCDMAYETSRLIIGYTAARSARFEHKERHTQLRQKVDTSLEQVSRLQAKSKEPPPHASMPTLTIGDVKERWDWIKKRCKTRKDGAKVAAVLNGYTIIDVEKAKGLPVIVLQTKEDYYYDTLVVDVKNIEIIEWAITHELKQECKVRLLARLGAMPPLPDWDDVPLIDESTCDVCGISIGILKEGYPSICDSCLDSRMSKD